MLGVQHLLVKTNGVKTFEGIKCFWDAETEQDPIWGTQYFDMNKKKWFLMFLQIHAGVKVKTYALGGTLWIENC